MSKQEVVPMSPQERIKTILLLEKIRKYKEYAEKITISDSSHYKDKGEQE